LFLGTAKAQGACVDSNRSNGQTVGYDCIRFQLENFSAATRDLFEAGMGRWNSSSCNEGGNSFPYFSLGTPGSCVRTMTARLNTGFNPANDQSCGNHQGNQVNFYTQARKPTGQIIECTSDTHFADTAAHELGHTIGLKDQNSPNCSGYAMDQLRFDSSGVYQPRSVQPSECDKADATNRTPTEQHPPIPPPGPSCECGSPSDCISVYGLPGFGTWECQFCQCILANSPLVLYLPDYLSPGHGNQSWWKRGFCGPQAPTVCLDWLGDGHFTCTAWTEPGSEIAFLVALSDDDVLLLSDGISVRAEPWRHFFGNVTMGPEGDFPFVHGFAALAEYCGQNPDANSGIDLTRCGQSLHVWDDRSGDGSIDPDEFLDFQDLGVESLGDVRATDKMDKCGSTFPVESHAICSSHPGNGKCGTWLDVFFEPR
jgi:hypothetical protein